MFERNVKNGKEIDILSQKEGEICTLLRNENMSQTDQIFYCIRNALAHGTFSYIKSVYTFENFDRGKLKGRIRVNQKTLLKWIDLCSMGVEEIKEIVKN